MFAFYFVDEDEKIIFNAPKIKKGKNSLSEEEQELDFKRYQRRIRNDNILFKCLAIFVIQLSLIILMIKYYRDLRASGYFHDGGPETYGNICLKLICSYIAHLIMQPCVFPPIERLLYIINHRD